MRLTRVHVDAPLTAGSVLEMTGGAGTHLAKVLRVRGGDELLLFNGDGREFLGIVEAVRGARVSVSIGAGELVDKESPLRITLIQAVPRGEKMDLIVQKATELGAARIVPVLSQRSVVRLDAQQASTKQAHWQAVAVSACEQCGRSRLPQVDAPQALLQFLGSLKAGNAMRWVFSPDSAATVAGATRTAPPPSTNEVDIAIGPEGGFAADEIEAFGLAQFVPMSLGPRVLRTETAALAAIVCLQTMLGDMSPGRRSSSS